MPAELIDTHCHLNFDEHFADPWREIDRAAEAGVTHLVVVGCDEKSSRRAVALAESRPNVFAVVGRHPNEAAGATRADRKWIDELWGTKRVVAIGEIGLDYHWDFATKEQQFSSLRNQLDLARVLGAPVVFHCRNAYDDLLDLVESDPLPRMLFHCFSGTADHALRAAAVGAWIGVDGPLTYPKADELRQVVMTYPRDRVVLETDSPYLSPIPHRGKPNHPAFLPYVNHALARCWGVAPEESARQTSANARAFFGLDRFQPLPT